MRIFWMFDVISILRNRNREFYTTLASWGQHCSFCCPWYVETRYAGDMAVLVRKLKNSLLPKMEMTSDVHKKKFQSHYIPKHLHSLKYSKREFEHLSIPRQRDEKRGMHSAINACATVCDGHVCVSSDLDGNVTKQKYWNDRLLSVKFLRDRLSRAVE